MTAWIEDAQILTDLKDLNRSQNSLLKRTTDVEDFLADLNLPSSALVAPKGFGKTFVLKLKRVSLQRHEYNCLPHGLILDRPKDRPPILPHEILDLLAASENWETLWQISFTIAVLKAYHTDLEANEFLAEIRKQSAGNSRLEMILSDSHIDTPFEIIHSCLSASRSDFFDLIAKAQFITAAYSRFSRRAAIFIDNIDEYLESYIHIDRYRRDGSHKLYLKLWHNGQIGAWLAIRRLHGINPHIKIYISLRKEAYHYASLHEAGFSNLKSFAHELRYSMPDIREIIENNIFNESGSKLSDKTNSIPIIRFVGTNNEFISNSGTGKHESTLDYWLRHCTGRPRDAVAIGGDISKIKVESRNISAIRSAINNAASERVQNLFSEVVPFFDGFFPDLFPRVIKSNVLTRSDIDRSSKEYSALAAEKYGATSEQALHPFCALYAIGLIGVVTENRDRVGNLIQKFSIVGQVPFGTIGILPYAQTYLIHPSLSDYIINKNVTYLSNLNRHNIVGDGLEWRTEEEVRFVAVGDMRGFRSKIMESVSGSQTFDAYWKNVFLQHTSGLDFAQTSGGDSVLLADRSPTRLIRSLRGLTSSLRKSKYGMQMRFGGHSGHWRLNHDAEGVAHPEISDIVGVAARLEPKAKPGSILFTQTFLDDAQRIGAAVDREGVRIATMSDVDPEIFDIEKGILISKKGKEEPQWFKCHVIDNLDSID